MPQRLDYEAIAPQGVRALGDVYRYIARSGLDALLVELIYLRISQINGCAYCLDLHTKTLLEKGVSPRKLGVLQAWREVEVTFSARECAALPGRRVSPACERRSFLTPNFARFPRCSLRRKLWT
ncbi:carboxymuconolactone decarboxylase family protein [Asaia bogorensis]|uniref:carboxymuconolactone decarboxylase family protein n=1 Tax=Asaia bogorensis TaxID=91915 RepID=UPI00197BBC11|nr:carboxymuconolactone decarboxylase family protein [Asaia bogorensis]